MAFDKKEIKQLKEILISEVPKIVQPMLDKQRSEIMVDVRTLLNQEIKPELEWIKNKLNQLFQTENEDIQMNQSDIAFLKKKVKELESKIRALELARS